MTHDQFKEVLEQYIDANSITDAMMSISEICHEKSAHVLHTWQDESTAEAWTICADRVEESTNQLLGM